MAVSSPNEFRLPVAEREDVAEVFLTIISKRPVTTRGVEQPVENSLDSQPALAAVPSAKTPTMIRIPPATFANAQPDAALGGAQSSKLPAQIKTNNQHTKLDKAMPVRTPQ